VTAPTEHALGAAADDPPAAHEPEASATDGPSERPRHRPAHAKPHQRWWRYGFPILLLALVVAIPVLVWVGARVVLDSSDGRIVSTVTDPAAPGFEATVEPTPMMAVAIENSAGGLDSVAVLTLTGENSGSVVMVSPDTLMVVPGIGSIPLSVAYGTGDVDSLRDGLQGMLGVGLPELIAVQATEWADLVRPIAPIPVSNPDAVTGTTAAGRTVEFAKGDIELSADEVWAYLNARNAGESDLNRLVRIEAFWQGWARAVAEAGDRPGVVPGETESGLGRFVPALAAGQVDAASLPVREVTVEGSDETFYEPDKADVQALITRIAPFPAGPEGTRAHVTVLDGTGTLDHGLDAAIVFAANGAQIDKIGNAPEFGLETTQFIFYDEAVRSRVQRMRDAIGVGELVKSDELNVAVDVIVVLGADHAAAEPQGTTGTGAITTGGGG
jgi:hypothetical protein